MVNTEDLFRGEDIFKMKANLCEEGFEENEKPIAVWRIIRKGENLLDLKSRKGAGVLYQTLNLAQEFMEDSEGYNDKHVIEMEELCMADVEAYLELQSYY